jgi:hypothetical protein
MQIPNPYGMDLLDWASATMYSLTNYVNVAPLEDPTQWQSWGQILVNSPTLGLLAPPNPYDFKDWEPWAQRVSDALASGSGSANVGIVVPPGFAFLVAQTQQVIQTQSGQTIILNGYGVSPGATASPFQLTDDAGINNLTDDSGANLLTSQ